MQLAGRRRYGREVGALGTAGGTPALRLRADELWELHGTKLALRSWSEWGSSFLQDSDAEVTFFLEYGDSLARLGDGRRKLIKHF